MALTKKQCKEILRQAKKADACEENYLPAKAAYKAGDYEMFEKICRGNTVWLQLNGVLTPYPPEGPYIRYSDAYVYNGFVDEDDDTVGMRIVYHKDTNNIYTMRYYNEDGKTLYRLCEDGYCDPKTANVHLKAIADEIYKHLGIDPTP